MNDHIGDTNKMIGETPRWRCTKCGREGAVGRCCGDETRDPLNDAARLELKISDTPRTDAARHDEHDPYMAIAAECSKLERELNAANKTIRLQHELMTTAEKRGVDKAKEELNEAKARIKRLEEAGDRMRLYCADADDCFAWDKAKEAKP